VTTMLHVTAAGVVLLLLLATSARQGRLVRVASLYAIVTRSVFLGAGVWPTSPIDKKS